MAALPKAEKAIPLSAYEGIAHTLPHPQPPYQAVSRRAGLGSLGHQWFVGLADWNGGQVAREAKALVPSAWLRAEKKSGPLEILYQAMLTQAVRCRDPYVELRGDWILRRVDFAASGAGLFADFADDSAGCGRCSAPAGGDGLRDGKRPSQHSGGD